MVVCERAGSRSPLGVQVAFVLFVCVEPSTRVDTTRLRSQHRDAATHLNLAVTL
jgi:hypothetical protein